MNESDQPLLLTGRKLAKIAGLPYVRVLEILRHPDCPINPIIVGMGRSIVSYWPKERAVAYLLNLPKPVHIDGKSERAYLLREQKKRESESVKEAA